MSYHSITTLSFYNYLLTLYGIYSTVKPFDPPTQNTINSYADQDFKVVKQILYRISDIFIIMTDCIIYTLTWLIFLDLVTLI